MTRNDGRRAYFNRRFWTVLGAMEFEEFEGDLGEENSFGPEVNLSARVSFDGAHLAQLARKKRDYLEAARQESVSDEEVLDSLAHDVADAMDIIFNKVGYDAPDEGVYKKVNSDQWKQSESVDYYQQYRDLLWGLTEDIDGVPSIPGLYREFLFAVAESDEHDLPPEGVVEDILSEHIDSIRAEEQSRAAVSKLKQELESRGMYPRGAASTAKGLEEFLKSDAQLREEGLLDDDE